MIADQQKLKPQDDFLAGELPLHQGCVRHAPPEDGGVDGERRKGGSSLQPPRIQSSGENQ